MEFILMSGPPGPPEIIDDPENYPESSAEMVWAELRCPLSTDQRERLHNLVTQVNSIPYHNLNQRMAGDKLSARAIRDFVKEQIGGQSSVPDFGRLKMKDFRTMLRYAHWAQDNTASKIVLGRLWMGDYDSKPQFFLALDFPAEFSLRLNGHVLHLPETDFATCENYDVDSILPSHFAALRYRPVTPGQPSDTLYIFVLGDVLARRLASDPWESTGLILVAELIKLDPTESPNLFLIYNSTNEDVVNREKKEILGQEYDDTLLKITTDSLLHFLQIERSDFKPEVGITVKSKERLEFFELGVGEDILGRRNNPVSLVPVSKRDD